MIFHATELSDALIIEPERREDERGFFARTWCLREVKDYGIDSALVQCNISFNTRAGTLRGMHYQVEPYREAKLVRCTMGSIYDVIIDLRSESLTFGHHMGVTLSANNRLMLYVPAGFAHGFLTLEDTTEVFYQMSEYYAPGYARGIRWNDPAFAIQWPAAVQVIAERDQTYSDFALV